MIRLGRRAEQQVAQLLRHYARLGRPEARRALLVAVRQASERIEANPGAGLLAPRPYPELAVSGEAWIKSGRYWVVYSLTEPPVILAVFHDAADIPGRA